MAFELPPQYGYVVIAALVYCLECLLVGFGVAQRTRFQIFTQDYMNQNFGELHREAFNTQLMAGGYPDSGSGFYSKSLSYKDWFTFNNAQRAHLNFVQMATTSMVFLLAAGLYFPIPAASLGLAMILFRAWYVCGYRCSGPNGRIVGALLNDLMIVALFILGFISAVYLIQT